MKELLKLSKMGNKLFDEAIDCTRKEYDDFERVRTRFYYPLKEGETLDSIELRTMIDEIVEEFKIDLDGVDRDSKYFKVLWTRILDILEMKMHRLTPDNYLIVTRNPEGQVVFIIRDSNVPRGSNAKIVWNDMKLNSGKNDTISIHATRNAMDLNT